ncbi:sugar transporter SWEET1-like isoform X1 [Uloborus diversus]|uniref:sugar transporter SWEET1-like isoform X1 n=1 Tax=Uloborus diversus TaxID=327109 RepID=UPI0024097F35|nr:sugar transporter SWEET1-like isoform X1 [Uloborus diversus]
MDFTLIVGNLAVICTIFSNFSGLAVCVDICKNRSTGNVSILPFVCSAVSASLWLQYALLINDSVLIMVNFISFILQASCICCYYLYTVQRKTIQKLLLGASIYVFSTHAYAFHWTGKQDIALNITGFLACLGSIITSGVPLINVKQVFRTRSTETLPFSIIFATFVVTVLWFFYGILIQDFFIQIPNFLGALLSGFQLCLFAFFMPKSSQTTKILK